MAQITEKQRKWRRRKLRVRKKVFGTELRPRLSLFKSNRHIYAQAIDDNKGYTLLSLSTQEAPFKQFRLNIDAVSKLGEDFGKRLKESQVIEVVFDRNGSLYHGVIKSFADGVRKSGINF